MRRYWPVVQSFLSRRSFPSATTNAPIIAGWPLRHRWRRWTSIETVPVAATAADALPLFELRDYQEQCIQEVLKYQEEGHRRLGISLATGSGKTVIFTQLIERVKPIQPNAYQSLILVHRRELVEQAASHCRRHYPDKTIEIEMGKEHATGTADITVASIQSINSGPRLQKFLPENFKLILIDEAHHAVAKSYRSVLDYFGAMSSDSKVQVVGVSATFSRADGVKLGAVMDHIVFHRDFVDMIEDGWLSKVMFTTVKTNLSLDQVEVNRGMGDFSLGDLSMAVNTPELNDVTVRSWMEKAGERKSTLVFCVDITHVVDMTNTFRRHGYEAYYVTGETAPKERARMLEEFRQGKYPVLVNCGVFTEGTDIPNIDCVLLVRPTRSRTLLVQMIGRGMRLHPGKEDCHVVDVVGSISKGVVTTPTLFGLDPEEVLDRTPSEKAKDKFEELQKAKLKQDDPDESKPPEVDPEVFSKPWTVTFVDYDSIQDLLSDNQGDWNIRRLSLNAWVWVSPGKFVLNCTGDFLTLRWCEETKSYEVTQTRALPEDTVEGGRWNYGPFMKPRTIIKDAKTLEAAVNGADTFVERRYPRALLRHDVEWRKTGASDGQLVFLAKRTNKDIDEYREMGLTKGQAADQLTRLKHGAGKFYQQLQVMKRKETQKTLKSKKISSPLEEDVPLGQLRARKIK